MKSTSQYFNVGNGGQNIIVYLCRNAFNIHLKIPSPPSVFMPLFYIITLSARCVKGGEKEGGQEAPALRAGSRLPACATVTSAYGSQFSPDPCVRGCLDRW